MSEHRSVSQVKTYLDCPQRYYLERIAKAWQRPAAWFPQGTAVHTAIEAWEKSGRTMAAEDAQEVFRDAYVSEVNRMTADTPNFSFWFSSGRYGGEADVERRFGIGLEQTARYVEYYTEIAPEETIWVAPDGTPAIELEFDVMIGAVRVRGFIDGVITFPNGEIRVRDAKTGKTPGDDFQLGTYGEAIRKRFNARVARGDYWMGGSGKPTVPYKLDYWTPERLAEEYERVDTLIRAEKFDPNPETSKCSRCSVSTSCPIFQS